MSGGVLARIAVLLCFAALLSGGEAASARRVVADIRRQLADMFTLNIPGVVNVNVAAPPKDEKKWAPSPGPDQVAVNVALGPNHPFHHKDEHKGDHKDGHNYKEKWIAPAPAKAVNVAITAPSLAEDKKDGSVDVGVNGRKLRQASADFPGGNVRVRGPAPGPAPAVAVNFPGGNVNVDPRTGVKVAFPGGNVNVSGRKLKAAAGKHA